MQINQFDKEELEILSMALRYWRAHRPDATRRTDPPVSRERLELLLAKLGYHLAGNRAPEPSDDYTSEFPLR